MTRDEAIAKTRAAMHRPGGIVWYSTRSEADAALAKIERDVEHFVDASVALGMLKLDEPNGVREKLDRAYSGFASLTPTGLLQQLERVGLKIVEK